MHGPDHAAASLIQGRKDKARAAEERATALAEGDGGNQGLPSGARGSGSEQNQRELLVGDNALSCSAALGHPDHSASGAVVNQNGAEEFQMMTPRTRNAVPSAESPDKLLIKNEAEAFWGQDCAAHTECTQEQEARHDLLAANLGGIEDASADEIAFVIWVDQLIPDYRTMYGQWVAEAPEERGPVPLQQFAEPSS